MNETLHALLQRIMPSSLNGDVAAYRQYQQDAMSAGQQPLPLQAWVVGGKRPFVPPQPVPQPQVPVPVPGATPGNPAGIQF